MSQIVGAPVRVQLMRWDEIGWDSTAPGALFDVRAGIDAKGNLVAFDFTQFYPQYERKRSRSPTADGDAAAALVPASGDYWPAPMYQLAEQPLPAEVASAQRGQLGQGGLDASRQQPAHHLRRRAGDRRTRPRGRTWIRSRSGSRTSLRTVRPKPVDAGGAERRHEGRQLAAEGRGVESVGRATSSPAAGFAWSNVYQHDARPTATIADIEVNKKTGKITVKHVYQAFSAGLLIYPGGVENQIDRRNHADHQPLARGAGRYSKTNVTSSDFVSYPILRFKDAPKVTPIVLQRTGDAPTRRRRAGHRCNARRNRQRVLRRDGCSNVRSPNDSGPRPRGTKSSRRRIASAPGPSPCCTPGMGSSLGV